MTRCCGWVALVFLLFCCTNAETSEKTKRPKSTDQRSDTTSPLDAIISLSGKEDRAIWQKPELVLKKLGDLSGKTLADIGAGTGYFSFRIVPRCKKVIAIDIDDDALAFMDSAALQLPENYKPRFETRKAAPDDPYLRQGEADVVLLVNTYSYIENRVRYFSNLAKKLAPGAQLLIIDYKRKRIPIGPPAEDRIPLSEAEEEIEQAGFSIVESDDQSLAYQYILHAIKK